MLGLTAGPEFRSDPKALVATVLAAVASGLTFLIARLIFLWVMALFDISGTIGAKISFQLDVVMDPALGE